MKTEKFALFIGDSFTAGWVLIGDNPGAVQPTYASANSIDAARLFDTTDEAHAAAEQTGLTRYSIQTVYSRE